MADAVRLGFRIKRPGFRIRCLGARFILFFEVDKDDEGGRARRDMNRCSTCKVIVMVGPPFGVPHPACDGIINETTKR